MSVLDGLTQTILISLGIFVGACASGIIYILVNIKNKKKNNKNTKLDTVV